MRHYVICISAGLVLSACASTDVIQDYDGCILTKMQGVTSDTAATQIQESCRKMFPPAYDPNTRQLSKWELIGISGEADVIGDNKFGGYLHNYNDKVTVTQLNILVSTKSGDTETSREYTVPVNIPPLSKVDFSFDFVQHDKQSTYKWGLSGGRGYVALVLQGLK